MANRIANLVVLVEDQEQQNLIRRYLERSGHNVRRSRFVPLPSEATGGSGEQYVRERYPEEVSENRQRVGRGASALLVVMIDADKEETKDRSAQLANALRRAGVPKRGRTELIVVLIPRRHVETWIRALLGDAVDERIDYKNPKPTSREIGAAAETLYAWTRPNADPRLNFPPSLISGRPEWRKIPS